MKATLALFQLLLQDKICFVPNLESNHWFIQPGHSGLNWFLLATSGLFLLGGQSALLHHKSFALVTNFPYKKFYLLGTYYKSAVQIL